MTPEIEAALDALVDAARSDGFNDTGPVPIMAAREKVHAAIRAALPADGQAVVPREPTPKMIEAYVESALRFGANNVAHIPHGYRAMLAAATVDQLGEERRRP